MGRELRKGRRRERRWKGRGKGEKRRRG